MPNKDLIQINKADATAKRMHLLYLSAIKDIVASSSEIKIDEGKPFEIKNFPKFEKKVNESLNSLTANSVSVINQATNEQWIEAWKKNQDIATPFLKRKLLTEAQQTAYTSRNLDALKSFQQRKINGLHLSDRVWKYTNQFKGEVEMSIDVALEEGMSANKLSQNIRKYLQQPEQLFRRVRDKNGSLHLSKVAKKYHPGGGAYRSSYKNAMRLARTEVNMAYRASDYEKYQQFDFVIGFEVKRSNHVYSCSVCESLKGYYPKTFKFVGWHPQCRCFTVPIMNKMDDFIEQQKSLLRGEQYKPTDQIDGLPDNFKNWYKENNDRISRAKSLPYFLKDNNVLIKTINAKQEGIYPKMYEEISKTNTSKGMYDQVAESKEDNYSLDEFFKENYGSEEKIEALLKEKMNDSSVYMMIDKNTLINKVILGDGEFKNSLQTGKGTFKTIGEDRAIKERAMFGIAEKESHEMFPKYGFISSSDQMGYENIVGWGYGDVIVKFKRGDVLKRTTFTLGDSYDGNRLSNGKYTKIAPAVKLDDPKARALYSQIGMKKKFDYSKINTIDDFAESVTSSTYIEAQVYGKLTFANVEAIEVSSVQTSIKLEKAFKKAKVTHVKIKPSKFDERIKYTTANSYDGKGGQYATSFSELDVNNFGDSIVENLSNRWLRTLNNVMTGDRSVSFSDDMISAGNNLISRQKIDGLNKITINASMSERREFLKTFARDMANGKMPKFWMDDYKKSLLNWTDDVMNKSLLNN